MRAVSYTVAIILMLVSIDVRGAIFVPLGDLAGGGFYSRAMAVSADGRVVVGQSTSSFGDEAFRWENGTMMGIGDLPDGIFSSDALGISGDGSVIVGVGTGLGNASIAFRWESGTMTGLGFLPGGGFSSRATGVSTDGSVVIGDGHVSGVGALSFRWEAGVMDPLSIPSGAIATNAIGISSDATAISGNVQIGGQILATRWDNNVPTLLGGLSTSHDNVARAISGNGLVVVGDSGFGGGTEAIRWIGTQLTGLGDLPGGNFFSIALAASFDGSVIVGRGESSIGYETFIWRQSTGIQNLRELLISQGVGNLGNWRLEQANGISADGNVIVGWGINPDGKNEAWMVNLNPVPEPASLAIWGGIGIVGLIAGWRRRRPMGHK